MHVFTHFNVFTYFYLYLPIYLFLFTYLAHKWWEYFLSNDLKFNLKHLILIIHNTHFIFYSFTLQQLVLEDNELLEIHFLKQILGLMSVSVVFVSKKQEPNSERHNAYFQESCMYLFKLSTNMNTVAFFNKLNQQYKV